MSRPPLKVDAQLAASLRRVSGALEQSRGQFASAAEQISAAAGEVSARVAERTDEIAGRIVERHERRLERRRGHEERRRRRRELLESDEGDVPRGIVLAVVAVTCLMFAVFRPQFFWMVFVALGFGMSAASSFARAARRRQLEQHGQPKGETEGASEPTATRTTAAEAPSPAPTAAEPSDPKVVRIQTLCDKLLAELESGPPIVREVVTEPRTTIGGLRQACLETARRERELRAVLATQDEASLGAEREALAARVSQEQDPIVRDRLGQALAALEQQLVHRAALATAATRLEAENTRILYTLENVRMQLLRARSTDIGAPELGGRLRESLRELGTQIEAVAEALEFADTPAESGGEASVARPPAVRAASDTRAPAPDEERAQRDAAARAEREAARRAAAARDAQHH